MWIYFWLFFFISFFPGCRKVKIEKDFYQIQKKTAKRIGAETKLYTNAVCIKNNMQQEWAQGISRMQAVGIALKHNPGLQADFDNLGIAKADLVQAGLYTNPSVYSLFAFPNTGDGQTGIGAGANVKISDFWQVPLRKKVSEDELEIISLRILYSILELVAKTKHFYNECLFRSEQIKNAEKTLDLMKEFRDQIYYRQYYGYSSDLDKYQTDAMVALVETELLEFKNGLQVALINLKEQLGNMDEGAIQCTTDFYMPFSLLSFPDLQNYALKCRPEIQIVCMKIKKYKDTISLEKASVWNDVDFGLLYDRDLDKGLSGWGPALSFSLPIFDTNYAQIAKARFLYRQAEKELLAEKNKVLREVRNPYTTFKTLEQEMEIYIQKMIPTREKGILWARKFMHTMQVPTFVFLQTQIDLYETKKRFIEKNHERLHAFIELERMVGKKLE